MLLGEYDHTIDDKNRLTLPAKFRQALADEVVVARGMDGCLVVYTRANWDDLAASAALSTAAHTAYHFGAIRQILAALKPGE